MQRGGNDQAGTRGRKEECALGDVEGDVEHDLYPHTSA